MTNQTPLLRLSAATLPALHRALARDLDPAGAARLARQFGFESGEAFHDALSEWALRETGAELQEVDPDAFWDLVGAFFAELGWGELEHERLHAGVASLRAREWREAVPDSGARHPSCHVTTGLLADLLSRVAGTDLAVMEVECRSAGDEACRFLVGGPAALSRIYETLRGGGDLSDALEGL